MFEALAQNLEKKFLNAIEDDDIKEFNITLSLVEPSTSLSSLALRSAIEQNSLKVLSLLFEQKIQPADSNNDPLHSRR